MKRLIDPIELHRRLDEVAVFDVRWELAEPAAGRKKYEAGHIPGAVFVDLDRDLSGADGPGRHPLPPPGEFAATLGRLGLANDQDVAISDDASGSVAARMWWMLTALGHQGGVAILDGGWRAWLEEDLPVETGWRTPRPAVYSTTATEFPGTVDRDSVRTTENRLLLDARAAERYRGETEPVDPRPGHIPGAVNLPWSDLVDSRGRLAHPASLRQRFLALGADDKPVIVSCGSGVTSCLLALAMEVAGFERPLLYPGSFSEWSASDLPVAEGPGPA